MKSQKLKDFRTSVILSEQQHRQLQDLAEANDSSIARLIRQALTLFLDSEKLNIAGSVKKKPDRNKKKE